MNIQQESDVRAAESGTAELNIQSFTINLNQLCMDLVDRERWMDRDVGSHILHEIFNWIALVAGDTNRDTIGWVLERLLLETIACTPNLNQDLQNFRNSKLQKLVEPQTAELVDLVKAIHDGVDYQGEIREWKDLRRLR